MSGAVRLTGSTSGYVELRAPAVAGSTVLELPTDSIQPGLVFIDSATASADSEIIMDGVFDSTYDDYLILWDGVIDSGTSAGLYFQTRAGGATLDSNYVYAGTYQESSSGSGSVYNSSASQMDLFGIGVTRGSAHLMVYGPHLGATCGFAAQVVYRASSTLVSATVAGHHDYTATRDGFRLSPSAYTFTGTVRVYGYRKA